MPLVLVAAFIAPSSASATVVDFDSVAAAAGGTVFAGGTFASEGVSFQSGSISSGPFVVGEVITFASPEPFLLVLGNPNAISGPNFAAASGVFGGLDDILMSFSTPVTSVSLVTDDADSENADVVRLLALTPTGMPFQFTVVAIANGFDDGTTPLANLLSVSPGGLPFSFALFQVTTEAEGFDDLTFTPVAEPGGITLLALGLASLVAAMRQRR
jgi:hypothetical protein